MKLPRTHLLVLISMCCLVAVNIGLLSNVQGLFLGPIAEELGVLKGAVSLTITISSICGGLGGMLVPKLIGRKHLRPVVIALAAIGGLATAGCSLCHSMASIYALCVVRGLASGALGMVFATSILNNWFHANIGLFTSIAVGCSGLAGSVFSLVFSDVIELFGWRVGYVVMALCSVVLIMPTILFVPSAKPEDVRLVPFGETSMRVPSSVGAGKGGASAAPVAPVVFAMIVAYAVLAHGPASVNQHIPGLGTSYGFDAAIGATMLSAAMVVNTVGKVAFGALSDRIGAKRTILLYAAVVCCALGGLLILRGKGALIGSAAVFGLTFSLNTVGVTIATRELCGQENYGKVYPVATLAGSASYASLSSVYGYLYDFTGGYGVSLVIALVMTVLAAGSMVVAYGQVEKQKA